KKNVWLSKTDFQYKPPLSTYQQKTCGCGKRSGRRSQVASFSLFNMVEVQLNLADDNSEVLHFTRSPTEVRFKNLTISTKFRVTIYLGRRKWKIKPCKEEKKLR
ncbi:hypothetical protein Bpfe_015594, partial [Biomphalaria pfeifferi]